MTIDRVPYLLECSLPRFSEELKFRSVLAKIRSPFCSLFSLIPAFLINTTHQDISSWYQQLLGGQKSHIFFHQKSTCSRLLSNITLLGRFYLANMSQEMPPQGHSGHNPSDQPSLQQQQQQQQQPGVPVPPLQSSADSQFQCQWVGCGERAANAEQLYVGVHLLRPVRLELTVTFRTMSARAILAARAPTISI